MAIFTTYHFTNLAGHHATSMSFARGVKKRALSAGTFISNVTYTIWLVIKTSPPKGGFSFAKQREVFISSKVLSCSLSIHAEILGEKAELIIAHIYGLK